MMEELLERGHGLEEEGSLEAANEVFDNVMLSYPDQVAAMFSWASFKVRVCPGEVAQDQVLAAQVHDAMVRCAEIAENKCVNNQGSVSEDDLVQASAIFGLLGVFMSRLVGDLEMAVESFEKSLKYNAANVDTLYCYATFLDQGCQQTERACELYEKLLKIDPHHVTAINNYSAMLIELSRGQTGSARESTLEKAKGLLTVAQGLAPGFPAYNIACVAATRLTYCTPEERQRNLAECRRWLLTALETGGIPDVEALKSDDDLEIVRNTEWFRGLIGRIELSDENFMIPFDNKTIVLKEMVDRKDNNTGKTNGIEGTTGWTIWNSSYVTLRYIEELLSRKDSVFGSRGWWQGRKVLDLSAGLGLLGAACNKLGAEVTMTDIGARQLESLWLNASLNDSSENPIHCQELPWGDNVALDKLLLERGPFDLVLASDLIYIAIRDQIQAAFHDTLGKLLQTSGDVLLVFEERVCSQEKTIINNLAEIAVINNLEVKDSYVMDLQDENNDGLFGTLQMHEKPTIHLLHLVKRQ
mmetsp:Transcript_30310/g.48236  ORF Transcript_30310/g.48236 Transcript_30310/m.48236 type:complete len:527 (-) Transcript_30310:1294-2874(-)